MIWLTLPEGSGAHVRGGAGVRARHGCAAGCDARSAYDSARGPVRAASERGLQRAAAGHLVQRDAGGDAGVEGLDGRRHRDRDDLVAGLADQPGQALALGADDDDERLAWPARGRAAATSPSMSRPRTKKPAFWYSSSARVRLVARATGIRAAAPAEVFQALAVMPADRRSGTTTPWPPKAATERTIGAEVARVGDAVERHDQRDARASRGRSGRSGGRTRRAAPAGPGPGARRRR